MEPLEIQSWRKGINCVQEKMGSIHGVYFLYTWQYDISVTRLMSLKGFWIVHELRCPAAWGSVPVLPQIKQLSKGPVMHSDIRPFQKGNKSPFFQGFGRKGSTLSSIITVLVPPFRGSQVTWQAWLISASKKRPAMSLSLDELFI